MHNAPDHKHSNPFRHNIHTDYILHTHLVVDDTVCLVPECCHLACNPSGTAAQRSSLLSSTYLQEEGGVRGAAGHHTEQHIAEQSIA